MNLIKQMALRVLTFLTFSWNLSSYNSFLINLRYSHFLDKNTFCLWSLMSIATFFYEIVPKYWFLNKGLLNRFWSFEYYLPLRILFFWAKRCQFLLVHEMNHFVKGIFLLQIILRIFNGFTLQRRHNVFHQVEFGFLQLVSEDQVAVLLGIHTHVYLVYLRGFVFWFIFIFNLILVKQRYFQLLWFLKSKCLILRSWFLRKSVRDFEIYFLIRIIVYLDLDGCFLIGTNHTRYLVRCWSQHQNVLIFAWVQVSMFHERRSD